MNPKELTETFLRPETVNTELPEAVFRPGEIAVHYKSVAIGETARALEDLKERLIGCAKEIQQIHSSYAKLDHELWNLGEDFPSFQFKGREAAKRIRLLHHSYMDLLGAIASEAGVAEIVRTFRFDKGEPLTPTQAPRTGN